MNTSERKKRRVDSNFDPECDRRIASRTLILILEPYFRKPKCLQTKGKTLCNGKEEMKDIEVEETIQEFPYKSSQEERKLLAK